MQEKVSLLQETKWPRSSRNGHPSRNLLNNTLDNSGYKRRFDELLGKRAPQFVSSLAALINSTPPGARHLPE